MDVWLTYRPGDFLLFSAEAYWRLFERANAASWPLPAVATLALAAVLVVALVAPPPRPRASALLAPVLLGAAWVIVERAFLAAHYEPINWAVASVRPAFLIEAGLLLVLAVAAPARHDRRGAVRTAGGAALGALALCYPLVGMAAGRPLAQAEVVAIAPDPTAIATLAVLALWRPGWGVRLLRIVPAAWLALSATTLLTMGEPTGWVPLSALAIVLVTPIAAHALPAARGKSAAAQRGDPAGPAALR